MASKYKSFTYDLLEDLGEEHRLGCKCCRFNQGTDLPIPRVLSLKDTEEVAREFSASIFKDWTRLNAILKRFEATIQKRWMEVANRAVRRHAKKSLKQRRELLHKAWPEIPTTHRPDFEYFRTFMKQAPRARTCQSPAFLWPHINLEDLQQRHLLLLFLNSRGRNIPEVFRIADVKAAHLGEGWEPVLDPNDLDPQDYPCDEYNYDEHCMLFQGKYSPRNYGKVVERSRMKLRKNQLKHVTRSVKGLLALEIQRGLYSFLLSCAKLILHDIKRVIMLFLAPCQAEPLMPSAKSEQWASFTGHALEVPYRVPQKMHVERLKLLAEARRSFAEDHLWMLREDPSYFIDTVREWNQHDTPSVAKICWCSSCHIRAAGRMTAKAFISFIFWDDIYRKLAAMDPIDVQLKRANEGQGRLAAKDEYSWTALIMILQMMQGVAIGVIAEGLPTSPRLRNHYEPWGPSGKKRWALKSKSDEAAQRVYRLFDAIFRPEQRDLHGLQGLVQEVQYMLETDADASQYIDSWIACHFSELALLSELITSIDALAPWFDKNKANALMDKISVARQVNRTCNVVPKLRDVFEVCAKSQEGNMKQDCFEYPVDKRPSKANVDQMRAAEQHLDMFWWTLEIDMEERGGIRLERELESRMFRPRELHRTSPWREPIQLPSPDVTPQQGLSYVRHDIDRRNDSPSKQPERTLKEKIKTRGTAAAPDPRANAYEAGNAVAPIVHAPEKVEVPKNVYRVFCALLPSTSDAAQQRCEIAWNELVAAMDAVGLEPEKLYGSAWIFKLLPKDDPRRKFDLDRSIQFREPKEVRRGQKIPRPMVRMFGRRLRYAFGWEDGEAMFQCE